MIPARIPVCLLGSGRKVSGPVQNGPELTGHSSAEFAGPMAPFVVVLTSTRYRNGGMFGGERRYLYSCPSYLDTAGDMAIMIRFSNAPALCCFCSIIRCARPNSFLGVVTVVPFTPLQLLSDTSGSPTCCRIAGTHICLAMVSLPSPCRF